jgi:hypothetical protein
MRRERVLGLAVVLLTACATASGLQPGTGTTIAIDGRTYDQVWSAATRAVLQKLTAIRGE